MNNTLYHHGIKGQKWGKKNGPPYPLGVSDHSTSEKRAGWRKSLDRSYAGKHTKNRASGKSKDNSDDKKRGLTDKQKQMLKIGATETATVLTAYGTYRLAKSGKMDSLIDAGKAKTDELLGRGKAGNAGDIGEWKIDHLSKSEKTPQTVGGIKKLAKPESLSETLKNVNPHSGDGNYDNNCTLCSIASFLRQNGYDVTAGKTGGKQQNLGGIVERGFKGAKVLDGSAVKFGKSRQDAAEMLIKRYGQNAEGVCSIQWKGGGGHAFNWKIRDGIVSFFDGQKNRNDSIVSLYWSRELINPNGNLQLARLDDAEINLDVIKELLE